MNLTLSQRIAVLRLGVAAEIAQREAARDGVFFVTIGDPIEEAIRIASSCEPVSGSMRESRSSRRRASKRKRKKRRRR